MSTTNNTTLANQLYPVANGVASSNAFVWQFLPRDPTSKDVNYPIQKFWLNTTTNAIWFLKNFVTTNGVVTADWIFVTTGGLLVASISDTANTPVFPTPPGAPVPNNIQLVGGTGINVVSTPASNLLTISANGSGIVEQFAVQTGTSPVGPSGGIVTFNGATVAAGTHPVRTDGTGANTMALEVQISQAIALTDATKIGLAAFDSADFTVDANGFVSATTTGFLKTLTGNTGGAIAPVANNINTVGTGSITIAGAGSTLTTQLTGLTNHAVQVGAGTATLTQVGPTANTGAVLQNNSGADPSYSTATYPSTTTINQILFSSAANTVTGLATVNRASLATTSGGVPQWLAMTDGQLIIGSTAGAPAASTLTAGTGITITNASNSITIAATAGGFTWSDKSTNFNAAAENGYFISGSCIATLPASPNNGDTIEFFVDGAFVVTITANTGQTIQFSTNVSSSAGTQANTASGDSCKLIYRSTDTKWCAVSYTGAWNKT